ncbi:GTP cyclohydrolase II [Sphingomonas sp.]|uniref:GTP cyclohydrolase II n=1 Tax=Sphingomonas sp. TaxID=28214 RepID=UPI00286D4B3E|nr:GTP cyclohydrolase II [Sphingomonas sp.]
MTAALAPAIAALRGGRAVEIGDAAYLSVETGTAEMLALLDPQATAQLLISGERAAALGLANEGLAAAPSRPVLIERRAWINAATAMAIVDPARDLDRGPIGPLDPVAVLDERSAEAALVLARRAGLLPALWRLEGRAQAAAIITSDMVLKDATVATISGRAKLPVAGVGETQVVAFRDAATGEEHVALIIGSFGGQPPLVRLHSECLTGDVFGSLKCDCGPQLQEALRLISASDGGVLLYLRQEGRGIGLANKIRAYQLQDRGLDTVDANRRLGFSDDMRDYGMAAAMLRALGIVAVRLLTNNPAKLAGLEQAGIRVVERVAHHMPVNPHNADYLATKRQRSGHLS